MNLNSFFLQYYRIFSLLLFLFFTVNPTLGQNNNSFEHLIDSADVYVSTNPKLAKRFLDSIEPPFEKSIKGRLSEYYLFRALLNDKENEQAKLFQNYLQALKFGEKEKNYDVAGQASLELFINIYLIEKDTTAYKYLSSARKFYTLGKNTNGLTEVMLMPAYVEFLHNNYEKSNKLILENIDKYRAIEDDAYYHLFAVYMLSSNHVHVGELAKANKYLKEFRSLKQNPTIDAYNYNFYDASLNVCMAEIQLEKKQIDSVFYYLERASHLRGVMSYVSIEDYFSTYSEAYKHVKKDKESLMYIDSLRIFQAKMLSNTLDASLEMNTSLIESEENLRKEAKTKLLNRYLAIGLLAILVVIVIIFFVRDNKYRRKLRGFMSQNRRLSHLKSKNEKLQVKSFGLEEYLVELKKKIKEIAVSEDIAVQRTKIKELYKNLLIESPTIIDKGDDHIELMRNLDMEFFGDLKNEYPELNDSDIIICYHLHVGFKNKEIALFLNRTVRAIESQRYRISKKMGLDNGSGTLVAHLNNMFVSEE